jgi:uncharacterized protein DUF4864
MSGPFVRMLSVLGLLVLFWPAPAMAGDDSNAAPKARALIEQQLEALARDDAPGAYALAAPAIKTKFADPDGFLAMVRDKYAPVYRHRSVEFGDAEDDGDRISQVLTIVDNDNKVWKALYELARQPDGTWLITGCVLIRAAETPT